MNTSQVDRMDDTTRVAGTTSYTTTAENERQGTPTEERAWAKSDLNGMRAKLVTELEQVRTRLNNGAQPEPQHTADQSRAAVLAQGLERIDRCLAAIDASTDATWADIRKEQRKEVEDVRAWMRDNRYGEATASTE